MIGSCIAAIGVAACPAWFRTVFPQSATFVFTFCGKTENTVKAGIHFFLTPSWRLESTYPWCNTPVPRYSCSPAARWSACIDLLHNIGCDAFPLQYRIHIQVLPQQQNTFQCHRSFWTSSSCSTKWGNWPILIYSTLVALWSKSIKQNLFFSQTKPKWCDQSCFKAVRPRKAM